MADSALATTLDEIRKRIERGRRRALNEQNTKATLIEPVLRALGWNTEDVEEVVREYKGKRQRKPVDYGLLTRREPRLLVEAKPLGARMDDNRWANQIMGYASVAGVQWIVLTNGDEYRIYNAHAPVPVDQKLWRSILVSQNTPEVQQTLELLAKDRLDEKRIDALWQAHFVDRQVRRALETAFGSDDDRALINLVRKHAENLTRGQIRASLQRCQISLDFPTSAETLLSKSSRRVRPSKAQQSKSRDGSRAGQAREKGQRTETSVPDLIDAGLIEAPMTIYRTYKGERLNARILADGRVRFGNEEFTSLSQAGAAARASVVGPRADGKLPPTNGWKFWRIDDVDRGGTPMTHLREQYEGGHRP